MPNSAPISLRLLDSPNNWARTSDRKLGPPFNYHQLTGKTTTSCRFYFDVLASNGYLIEQGCFQMRASPFQNQELRNCLLASTIASLA